MNGPASIRHVVTILAVADLTRSRRFYDEAFGWPTKIDVPALVEYELPGGGAGLGLYVRGGFAKNTGQAPAQLPATAISGTELYFHVADLAGAMRRLEAAGARSLSPLAPRDWGDEAAYYADPDGNVVVVARPL